MGGGGQIGKLLCLYRFLIRLYCIWSSLKVYSTETRPYPSPSLRISLGAFRTSPVSSLYAKQQEISLKNGRKKKKKKVYDVLKQKNARTILPVAVFLNHQTQNSMKKLRLTLPLGLRVLPLSEDSKTDLGVADDVTLSDTPP